MTNGSSINYANIEEYVEITLFQGFLDNFSVGRCTYIGNKLRIHGINGDLKIGRYCSIAGILSIIGGNGYHQDNRMSTYPFPLKEPFTNHGNNIDLLRYYTLSEDRFYDKECFPKYEVVIGNDVWIGEDVLVTKNVKIGNGAIIAAKSVVTKDVPSYSVVGGNPAKIIKNRFEDNIIKILEEVCWWDWSIDKIKSNMKYFKLTGTDLEVYLNKIKFK